MTYYDIYISKDKNRLTFAMHPFLRGIIIFFLISIVLMFIFTFKPEDFTENTGFGKFTTIFIPSIILLGALYKHSITFDKNNNLIIIKKGLIFLYKKNIYKFDDLELVYKNIYNSSKLDFHKKRADFGFYIKGRYFQIDRKLTLDKFMKFYSAFEAFWPKKIITND